MHTSPPLKYAQFYALKIMKYALKRKFMTLFTIYRKLNKLIITKHKKFYLVIIHITSKKFILNTYVQIVFMFFYLLLNE